MSRLIAGLLLGATVAPALAYTLPPIMPVYGVQIDGQGVTVRLPPHGCNTLKSDFTVAIAKSDTRPLLLIAPKHAQSLVACRSAERAMTLTWTYADLGLNPGQPFSLANPLVAEPSP